MTQYLPPNLLSLFFPRDPLPFKIPPKRKKCPKAKSYTGISEYLDIFEEPKDEPPVIYETRFERRERKRREKQERERQVLEERKRKWDPKSDVNATTDPYKTLFIARLSYETTESRLKREFEIFGPIKKIRIVYDKITNKNRGYAFIEYEHTRDMHAAYKHMDGKKIDGRRIIVDAERGRVEADWLPRYLGGGLGGHRRADRTKRSDRSVSRERGDFDDSERRRGVRSKSRSISRKRTYDAKEGDEDHSERHRSRSKRDHDSRKRHKDDDRSKHDKDRRHY